MHVHARGEKRSRGIGLLLSAFVCFPPIHPSHTPFCRRMCVCVCVSREGSALMQGPSGRPEAVMEKFGELFMQRDWGLFVPNGGASLSLGLATNTI